MTTDDRCAQPAATLALAFGVGSLLGLAWLAARCVIYPYRIHRFQHPR